MALLGINQRIKKWYAYHFSGMVWYPYHFRTDVDAEYRQQPRLVKANKKLSLADDDDEPRKELRGGAGRGQGRKPAAKPQALRAARNVTLAPPTRWMACGSAELPALESHRMARRR